jgi:hypothetical protein
MLRPDRCVRTKTIFLDLKQTTKAWFYTDILDFQMEQAKTDAAMVFNYGHLTDADNLSIHGHAT